MSAVATSTGRNIIVFKIDGVDHHYDTDAILMVPIGAEDSHRVHAAADLAWWGAILGMIERESKIVDAEYRSWAARVAIEAGRANGKPLSEAAAKTTVESDPNFMVHKRKIAETLDLQTRIRLMYEALKIKAETLKYGDGRARTTEAGATSGQSLDRADRDELMKAVVAQSAPKRREVLGNQE